MPSLRNPRSKTKSRNAQSTVATASRRQVDEDDDDDFHNDYVYQETYEPLQINGFSKKQLLEILSHRNVDVSKLADRKYSYRKKLVDVLEEDRRSKNDNIPSSGIHRQTRSSKKLKSTASNRKVDREFYDGKYDEQKKRQSQMLQEVLLKDLNKNPNKNRSNVPPKDLNDNILSKLSEENLRLEVTKRGGVTLGKNSPPPPPDNPISSSPPAVPNNVAPSKTPPPTNNTENSVDKNPPPPENPTSSPLTVPNNDAPSKTPPPTNTENSVGNNPPPKTPALPSTIDKLITESIERVKKKNNTSQPDNSPPPVTQYQIKESF